MLRWFQMLCAKVGRPSKWRGRSIIVVPADRRSIEVASELLDELHRRYPRVNFIFVTDSPALWDLLAVRFPGDRVLPFPLPLGFFSGWFLDRLNALLVLFLGAMEARADILLARALAREAPAAVLTGNDSPGRGRTGGDDAPHTFRLHVPREAAMSEGWLGRGAGSYETQVIGPLEEAMLPAVADRLGPLIGHESPERLNVWSEFVATLAYHGVIAAAEDRIWARWIRRKYDALLTLGALRDALGNPRTILCLGNGPSSEDPRVRAEKFDCLFRVNHTWLDRGLLTEPHAIFTGTVPTVKAIRRPVIFCLRSRRAEKRVILRCLFTLRRIRIGSIERYGVIGAESFRTHQPTNGAMMLATAVALKPERLIVAGIDLFQDSRGAYPGDGATPNAYTAIHDRNMELEFILSLFANYDGELLILSEVLNNYWCSYHAEMAAAADDDWRGLSRITTAL